MKAIPKATFHRWVNEGKIKKARDLEGWCLLNKTLVHQGMEPVDVEEFRFVLDGKGRALDNRMIERLWRSVKYDDIYIRAYESTRELYVGLERYFDRYAQRRHQGIRMSPEQKYAEVPPCH
ncbi:MAG: hypothetical protein ACQKBW_09985 [Puniceicoccales bacterium]